MERPLNSAKILQTDSIHELAKFWDTHDLTDFEDELEEVAEAVFERRTTVRVDLGPEEAEAVKRIAKARGINYKQLLREWIVEKLRAS